ncbi:MAG: Rab family GTPase [Promethearchaeota archaeon]
MGKIYTSKICVVGDQGVGKTSLLLKYSKNTFYDNYKPTLGADFIIKEENIKDTDDKFQLYIWDIAGNPTFSILRTYYMHGANGAFICFDLNNPESFSNVDKWLNDVYRIRPERIPVILVGTKCDKPALVNQKDIDIYCKDHGLPYLKTSSKDGTNIKELFQLIIKLILEKYNV